MKYNKINLNIHFWQKIYFYSYDVCVIQKTYHYKRSEYMYEDINIQIVLTTLRKETIMCCNFKKIHNLESYKGL